MKVWWKRGMIAGVDKNVNHILTYYIFKFTWGVLIKGLKRKVDSYRYWGWVTHQHNWLVPTDLWFCVTLFCKFIEIEFPWFIDGKCVARKYSYTHWFTIAQKTNILRNFKSNYVCRMLISRINKAYRTYCTGMRWKVYGLKGDR